MWIALAKRTKEDGCVLIMKTPITWLERKLVEFKVRKARAEMELENASREYLDAVKKLEACEEVLRAAREQEKEKYELQKDYCI